MRTRNHLRKIGREQEGGKRGKGKREEEREGGREGGMGGRREEGIGGREGLS